MRYYNDLEGLGMHVILCLLGKRQDSIFCFLMLSHMVRYLKRSSWALDEGGGYGKELDRSECTY